MRVVEVIRAKPWAAAIAVGGIAGLLMGALVPPPDAGDWTPGESAWALPAPSSLQRADEATFAKVRAAPFWGAASTLNGSGVQRRPGWRLIGIITDPVPLALVTADGQQDAVHVPVGGDLPDGGTVVRITFRGLSFERDGCTYARELYAPLDPAEAQPCQPPRP